MKVIHKIMLFASVTLLLVLGILAVVLYQNYGKGSAYFSMLIIPMIYVAIGLTGILTSKWWVILVIASCILLAYLQFKSPMDIISFIPMMVCYIAVSVGIGYNSNIFINFSK